MFSSESISNCLTGSVQKGILVTDSNAIFLNDSLKEPVHESQLLLELDFTGCAVCFIRAHKSHLLMNYTRLDMLYSMSFLHAACEDTENPEKNAPQKY